MTNYPSVIYLVIALSCPAACGQKQEKTKKIPYQKQPSMEIATFGAGCFWCVEAVFQELEGVQKVVAGYAGGQLQNPSYEQICSGNTRYAEVCQITYKPNIITYDELLEVFWQTHDPTTLNRQGNDVGTQYRSAVFYHNNEQKLLAEKYKAKLQAAGAWENAIVTQNCTPVKLLRSRKLSPKLLQQ